jgi:hypothetical protein
VAGDPYFWNLYVPYEPHAAAREQLWTALRTKDAGQFEAVAAAFGVTHVLAEGDQRDWVAQSGVRALDMVFSSKSFSIYAFRPLTPATGEPPES